MKKILFKSRKNAAPHKENIRHANKRQLLSPPLLCDRNHQNPTSTFAYETSVQVEKPKSSPAGTSFLLFLYLL